MEGGHSPRAITGIEKLAFDLETRLERLRDRIEAIRTSREDTPDLRRGFCWDSASRLAAFKSVQVVLESSKIGLQQFEGALGILRVCASSFQPRNSGFLLIDEIPRIATVTQSRWDGRQVSDRDAATGPELVAIGMGNLSQRQAYGRSIAERRLRQQRPS